MPDASARSSRVLFVCLGNICRSPAAEGVMRHTVAARDVTDRIDIDSAGTAGYHEGAAADARMRRAARARGYDLTSRARAVRDDDFTRFDLIVAMDRSNQRDLRARADRLGVDAAHVVLLSSFLDADAPVDCPDPYYGGAEGFETVLDLVERGCPAIVDQLLAADA
ncbi:MAG: low molecular weight protein-tyrosine-phosphatase [Acidobacteriota bacterium]